MKIKPEHYAHMRDAIRAAVTREQVTSHRAALLATGKPMDIDMRVRWDMTYAAKLTPWICANVYPYADDSHIDTALRAIVRECFA